MINGADLITWLGTLSITGYSILAPQGAVLPYVAYRKVAGGWLNKDAARYTTFELTCAADSYKDLVALSESIITAALATDDMECVEGAEDYIDGIYTAVLSITMTE